MELKIQCSCGSRYQFEVEPVNGRVPAPLSCPKCQANWTEHANAMIAQALGMSTPPVDPVAAVDAPAPTPVHQTPPTFPAPAKTGLRLSSHAPVASAPASAPLASEPAAPPAPAASVRHMPHVPSFTPVTDNYDSASFGRGFLGAALGALLGGAAFYLLFAHTGVRMKLVALGVGFLAGTGARLLGKDRSKELGVIAAVLSIGMIVGAQYLVAWKWFHDGELMRDNNEPAKSDYDERLAEAKKVVAAIPKGTDQEIRLYLAREQAEEGEKPDLQSIEPREIQEFKDEALPRYRQLADGTISRDAYDKEHTVTLSAEERQEMKKEGERVFKWAFIALLMGKFNLICIAGSAGVAFKMIANA